MQLAVRSAGPVFSRVGSWQKVPRQCVAKALMSDLDISDVEAERITTVAQAIAHILRHRRKLAGR
jgi:hypothetical protein